MTWQREFYNNKITVFTIWIRKKKKNNKFIQAYLHGKFIEKNYSSNKKGKKNVQLILLNLP